MINNYLKASVTLHQLGGLIPAACQSNAVSSSSPVPSPDFFPSAPVPLGTGRGQRSSLLAAPENLCYRPVSFNSIPLSEVGPFRGIVPVHCLTISPCSLHCTLSAQLKRLAMEINAVLSYIMAALAPMSSPVRPPLLFGLPSQAGVRGRTLGQSSLH